MSKEECCSCCNSSDKSVIIGEYVCYCNKVTENDIVNAIDFGADSVEKVI